MTVGGRLSKLFGVTLTIPTLFYAGFLMYPNVRPDDTRFEWLPVSPELIRMGLVLGILAWMVSSFIRKGMPDGRQGLFILFLFLSFLFGISNAEITPYAIDKLEKLFSSTMLCAFAPLLLLRSQKELTGVLSALALVGLLYSIAGLFTLAMSPDMAGRLTALGSNPITLGRAATYPFLWFCFLGLSGRISAFIAGVLVAPCFVVLVATGSRGPLVAALTGLAVGFLCLFRIRGFGVRRIFGAFFLTLFGLGILTFREEIFPKNSFHRLETFFDGHFGRSEKMRARAMEWSWETFLEQPSGIGWGCFGPHCGILVETEGTGSSQVVGTDTLNYPHNIFLEVLVEGGWLAGILFIGLCLWAIKNMFSRVASLEMALAFAFYCSAIVNASISGDINGNGVLVCLMTVGLLCHRFGERNELLTKPPHRGTLEHSLIPYDA